MKDVLTTGQAARLLDISPSRVHQLIREGKLSPAQETPLGLLFSRAAIERFAATRAAAKAAKEASA